MRHWTEIAIAGLVGVLLLWVEHWGPWQLLLEKKFHQTVNYILGTLALQLPFTGLLILWGMWNAVLALWAITILGGLAVLGAYGIDGWVATRTRLLVKEKESAILRPKVTDHDPGPEAG